MAAVMIGVDPHKGSRTAVVIDQAEVALGQIRVRAGAAQAEAEWADVDAGLFQPSESDVLAELELAAGARWVADYYPCDSVTELGEGRLGIVVRTPDTGWVRRLALRLGEEARVTAPAALAEEVRSAAAAALALYD